MDVTGGTEQPRIKTRLLSVGFAAAALVGVGAASASAWTFATTSAPQRAIYNGTSFGDGAGTISRSGYSILNIDVKLKDPVNNTGRPYQQTNAWFPTDLNYTAASTQTGRRSQGANTWASMNRVTINTTRSSYGVRVESKVCEDVSLRPDICSTYNVKTSLT